MESARNQVHGGSKGKQSPRDINTGNTSYAGIGDRASKDVALMESLVINLVLFVHLFSS
jgi:hypothetical protein